MLQMKITRSPLFRWSLLPVLLYLAVNLDTPVTMKFRPWDLILLLSACLVVVMETLKTIVTTKRREGHCLLEKILFFMIIIGVVFYASMKQSHFDARRYRVLQAPAAQVRHLGRHFIVGYEEFHRIRRLVEKGAVGGVYVTHRNAAGKTAGQLKEEIARLQRIQSDSGLPPLLIAADQEGGIVSRLSPPLPIRPSLSSLLRDGVHGNDLNVVAGYASLQALELSSIGVNLNLSPVVDLKPGAASGPPNDHTRIDKRAISGDAATVAKVALIYSTALARGGIIPTVKHFPGLGRVLQETHFQTGSLGRKINDLEKDDWMPFRHVIKNSAAFLMIGHVTVDQVDPDTPASFSEKVVQGIIRQKWHHNGILITDDLNMAPAFDSDRGIGGAAVKALNAGVDLLLISYDGDQYYTAMDAVLQAQSSGALDTARIAQSDRRLAALNLSPTPGNR